MDLAAFNALKRHYPKLNYDKNLIYFALSLEQRCKPDKDVNPFEIKKAT